MTVGQKPGVIAMIDGTEEEVFLPFCLMKNLKSVDGNPVFTNEPTFRRVKMGEEVLFIPNTNPNGKGRGSSWAIKDKSGRKKLSWGEKFHNKWSQLFTKAVETIDEKIQTPPTSPAIPLRTTKVPYNPRDHRLFRVWFNNPDGSRSQIDIGHLQCLASRMYTKGSIGPDITVEVREGPKLWTPCEKNPLEDAPFSPE